MSSSLKWVLRLLLPVFAIIMPKANHFFVNGKSAKLSDDLALELIRKYSKECNSPNDIYIKVSEEIGLARSKKSVMKLTNLYNKFVKPGLKVSPVPKKVVAPKPCGVSTDGSITLTSRAGPQCIGKGILIKTFLNLGQAGLSKSSVQKCCHALGVSTSTKNTARVICILKTHFSNNPAEQVSLRPESRFSASTLSVEERSFVEERSAVEERTAVEENDPLEEMEVPYQAEGESDKSKFWETEIEQGPHQFQVDQGQWSILRRNQVGRKFKDLNWTNVVVGYIKKYNPYCCICFDWHSVRTLDSMRGGLLFNTKGYCKFSTCEMKFTFRIKDEDLVAELFFGGSLLRHQTEVDEHARPVRGQRRIALAEEMKDIHPRDVYDRGLRKMTEAEFQSGNRDIAPPIDVLKQIAAESNAHQRKDQDEMKSLRIIKQEQEKGDERSVLRKIVNDPAGVMLWSKACIRIFHRRCVEDIVYLDATGGVVKNRDAPFYAYELVVRSALKGRSPFPVATFVTCCHTISSVTDFLNEFKSHYKNMYGWAPSARPKMIMSDGSLVLMNAIAVVFCDASLELVMERFFRIISGKALTSDLQHPVMHRCLSHVMKNAKMMCRQRIPNHYRFCMFVIGHLTTTRTLKELIEKLKAIQVFFGSPFYVPELDAYAEVIENAVNGNDPEWNLVRETIMEVEGGNEEEEEKEEQLHCESFTEFINEQMNSQILFTTGSTANIYYSPDFLHHLKKDLLPQAMLWTEMLLGDLGRHGTTAPYQHQSQCYNSLCNKLTQNITRDNRTQGIMEKSQWDLKHIRNKKLLNRLDDFVIQYQEVHPGMLRAFESSEIKAKAKERQQKKSEGISKAKERQKKKSEGIAKAKERREIREKWGRKPQTKGGVYNAKPTKPICLKRQIVNTTPSTHMDNAPTTDVKFWDNISDITKWLSQLGYYAGIITPSSRFTQAWAFQLPRGISAIVGNNGFQFCDGNHKSSACQKDCSHRSLLLRTALDCAFDRELNRFTSLLSSTSSKLSPPPISNKFDNLGLSPLPPLLGRGIMITTEDTVLGSHAGMVGVTTLKPAHEALSLLASTLLNDSILVLPRYNVHSIDVHHFIKTSLQQAEDDILELALRPEGTIQGLNVSVHRSTDSSHVEIRLRGNHTVFYLRYGVDMTEEREHVLKHAKSRALEGAWAIEKELAQMGKLSLNEWTRVQREELLVKGRVEEFQARYIRNIAIYTELADDPKNVAFVHAKAGRDDKD